MLLIVHVYVHAFMYVYTYVYSFTPQYILADARSPRNVAGLEGPTARKQPPASAI